MAGSLYNSGRAGQGLSDQIRSRSARQEGINLTALGENSAVMGAMGTGAAAKAGSSPIQKLHDRQIQKAKNIVLHIFLDPGELWGD